METNNFDESYFERGGERGTQYRDYLESAPKSRTYFEFAEAIQTVFRPKRTLEIGCAAGIVVSHIASFDVEAHGIDVSEWAVKNRFHENVIVASAAELPYDDNYFDVVYSVHALEHLPPAVKDEAIREMSRVCRGSQFHMMPMLESGPYVGDRFAHLLNLRTDPTHSLLHERQWWLEQFAKFGWSDANFRLAYAHDSGYFEFSDCQIALTRQPDPEQMQNASAWNFKIARLLSQALNGKPTCGLEVHVGKLRGTM